LAFYLQYTVEGHIYIYTLLLVGRRLVNPVFKLYLYIIYLVLTIFYVLNNKIWTSSSAGDALTSDLPSFSLTPQEYVTRIGQYLMTLPQQLEPFTGDTDSSTAVPLRAATKYGKIPYASTEGGMWQSFVLIYIGLAKRIFLISMQRKERCNFLNG
jgi:hypothetical protein